MHELIDAVTAAPIGPVTIGHGHALDITASFTLDGSSPGTPTTSTYTIQVSRVVSPGVYASIFGTQVSPATAGTDYTMTVPASELPIGSRTFVATATLTTDAPHFQIVHSNEITVHVVPFVRAVEAELPDRNVTAGLPERSVDAEAPARSVTAAAPAREVEATAPARTATARVD